MILATLTFRPDQYNAGRKGKGGVWRVAQCERVYDGIINDGSGIQVVEWFTQKPGENPVPCKALQMYVERPYRRGVIVDPRKLAMEFMHPLFFMTRDGLIMTVSEVRHG